MSEQIEIDFSGEGVRDPGKRFVVRKHRKTGGHVVWDEKLDRATGSHDMRLEQARELAEIMNRHEEQQSAERKEPPDESSVHDSAPPPEVQAALDEITRRVSLAPNHVHDSGCGCAHDSGTKRYSRAAELWIARKIRFLVKREGKPLDQAIAMAMSMAREKGLKVPARTKPRRGKAKK